MNVIEILGRVFLNLLNPLHPLAASDPLAVEFVLDMRSDPEFSGVLEVIHLAGEVFGEFGRVDHQQCLVVGVSNRGICF